MSVKGMLLDIGARNPLPRSICSNVTDNICFAGYHSRGLCGSYMIGDAGRNFNLGPIRSGASPKSNGWEEGKRWVFGICIDPLRRILSKCKK